MSDTNFRNTLSFWRSVEALSPQEVPKIKKDETSRGKDLGQFDVPLWLDDEVARLPVGKDLEWAFTVYGGLIERTTQVQALGAKLGTVEDVFDERLSGVSCLFSLKLNALGHPNAESFVLCMSTWATGVVLASGLASLSDERAFNGAGLRTPDIPIKHPPSSSGFPGFDQQAKVLRDELAWRISVLPEGQPVTMEWVHDFADVVATKCGVLDLFGGDPRNRVTAYQVSTKKKDDTQKQDEELINSFFVRDLNRALRGGLAGASAPLRTFVKSEEAAEIDRVDVRTERESLVSLLDPARFPAGCWPSEHPLVWSQQLAINGAWGELRHSEGLFAVNGPPGTGKTTLLRDLVAAVVVERARELSKLGKGAFESEKHLKVGAKTLSYFPLAESLSGFSIVVASSNNGAVENLSLELPLEKAIDPKWISETDYFKHLATHLVDEPAWGLLAAKLGNSGNRRQFSRKFYWPTTSKTGVAGIKELLEATSQPAFSGRLTFSAAKKKFDDAVNEEDRIRKELQSVCELPTNAAALVTRLMESQTLIAALTSAAPQLNAHLLNARSLKVTAEVAVAESLRELEAQNSLRPKFFESLFSGGRKSSKWRASVDAISATHEQNKANRDAALAQERAAASAVQLNRSETSRANEALARTKQSLDAANDSYSVLAPKYREYLPNLALADDLLEKSSPWSVPIWREARIKVFLAALALHRSFIEANAAKVLANLSLAIDMLAQGLPSNKARITAFDSIALVCPVISTAFASVSSMFGDIDSPAIGWLLIDEAGQAAPQACVGALWRSKRAIVVGDPLQLEPVVTIPHSVEASLAAHHGNVAESHFPTGTSGQRLADRQMTIGTVIGAGTRDAVWVGAPLRVHRRCDDPMFAISNAIAYGGSMVHQKIPKAWALPASQWLDVVTNGDPDGHWVPAEGVVLHQLLTKLRQSQEGADVGIFLVSPFKDVVSKFKDYTWKYGIDPKMVGTVHTTQGKEADVVVLVLGGGTPGGRNWAALRPNLLNVAVSRAKSRLYVIGDKEDWRQRRFFDEMARHL